MEPLYYPMTSCFENHYQKRWKHKMGECTIVICGLEIKLSNKYVEFNRASIKS